MFKYQVHYLSFLNKKEIEFIFSVNAKNPIIVFKKGILYYFDKDCLLKVEITIGDNRIL